MRLEWLKELGINQSLPTNKNNIDAPVGKHKGLPIKKTKIHKKIPKSSVIERFLKKLSEYRLGKTILKNKKIISDKKKNTNSAKTKANKFTHKKNNEKLIIGRPLTGKEATDAAIDKARNNKEWQELERITHSNAAKLISDNGFQQLKNQLHKQDLSQDANLKLLVLFAADKFEKGELSSEQMQQYVDVLIDKYTSREADKQFNASVKSLSPDGAERIGFSSQPLRASQSVQIAELIVTAQERQEKADANDVNSGVVHNYKRDLPIELYGWKMDYEALSRTIDEKLIVQLQNSLDAAIIRESNGRDAVQVTSDFVFKLNEGINCSSDEYADSLLQSAGIRVSSAVKKQESVKESEEEIKAKLSERKARIVSAFPDSVQSPLSEIVDLFSTNEMVSKKVRQWVKEREIHNEDKIDALQNPLDIKPIQHEIDRSPLPRVPESIESIENTVKKNNR